MQGFREGLRDLGYIEGQNFILELRVTDGNNERLPELAGQLVQLPVDVILAEGSPAIAASKDATATIPIVFGGAGDPVSTGFVDSLNRPGGNITGIANLTAQLNGKRLELLTECLPGLSTVGYLWDPTVPQGPVNWQDIQVAAQALGLRLISLELSGATPEFDRAFTAAMAQGAEGLTMMSGPFNREAYRERIVALAAHHRLPAMYPYRTYVDAGGLMGYGPDGLQLYRRAAYYVDRILKGAKPEDLPVEQPMTFEFVVNMKTAQALGITFPNEILLQVTEVIQ
jgi:putative ABC transport system substrate-binding protein